MKRLWLIVTVLLFAFLCEPLYALTPAQKRAKEKARKERKKEAEKRAKEKAKAAKAKAAKKQRIKDGKPLLYIYSYDLQTGERLPATHITIQDVNAKPNKKPKVNKIGRASCRERV